VGVRAKLIGGSFLVVVLLGALLFARMIRNGFSAQDEPSGVETLMARTMRRLAVPSDLRGRKNPVALTPEVLAEGRAHFADHCASCHGNDGKGQTAMGPNFYPPVPDMSLPGTQSQSDGEIFAVIENGIRLTGMPAWGNGTAESAYGTWTLVHFIRHLPKLSADELEEMKSLNPKTRAEWEAEAEEAQFLQGEDDAPEPAAPSEGHAHH
jgi:mono/diheme cytochrome c family protein